MIERYLFVSLILAFIPSQAFCQSEQLVINAAQISRPGLLTFENPKGSIKVTGYDGDVILVTGTLRFRDAEKTDENGMRRIVQNPVDISAEVNGNNVTILCSSTGKTVDFDIKIPRDFSLKLKSLDNGIVDIVNINGEIEVENTDGDILLANISGSAVLSSVYGKISAVFREADPDKPMMFTSFEGDVIITLPGTVNASLKMRTDRGEILSDFEIKPAKRLPVVKNVENTRIYSLEDWVTGTINAGGPEYIIRSYDGDIFLRKK
ncbi:MAG: DUF4097 family beta strand repeat protein [Bacteroidales bacterium]|nr:DUF4097 family beta strand repeat protein [Bacteroidales bacterium]